MHCDKCNVEITCKTDVCPLCHSPVLQDKDLTNAYAPRRNKIGRRDIPFSKWYFSVAALIVVIVAILNLVFARSAYWTLLVAGILLYLYYCIRITALSYRHLNMKIFGQTVALTALGVLLETTINAKTYVFEVILPLVFLIAIITVTINILMNIDNARSFLVSYLLVAILGVIPLIVVFIKNELFWPSFSVAIISLITLIILTIVARKKIAEEFKRIFHR